MEHWTWGTGKRVNGGADQTNNNRINTQYRRFRNRQQFISMLPPGMQKKKEREREKRGGYEKVKQTAGHARERKRRGLPRANAEHMGV